MSAIRFDASTSPVLRRLDAVVVLMLLTLALPASLAAQRRPASAPETELMAYFGTVMQFSPIGLAPPRGIAVGGSLGFIPALGDEDRLAGFGGTKYENTDFCTVFPRLTAGWSRGSLAAEAGWTPPVRVCGVQANIGALALSWRRPFAAGWSAVVRGSVVAGALEAAITCGPGDVGDPRDQTCFQGGVSNDRMAPLTFSGEVAVARRAGRLEPYLLAGLSSHRMHFDVNYDRLGASPPNTYPPLSDHNRFGATISRVHLAAGTSLDALGPFRLGAELYYAPASLFTVRGRASYVLGATR